MSPSGESLRNRCRNFPGLVGNTSIDWIFPWPEQALFSVATKYLGEHPSISELYKRDIVEHVVHVHNSVRDYSQQYLQSVRRKNFVTPKHYLDFISTYLRLIGMHTTGTLTPIVLFFTKKNFSRKKFVHYFSM